MYSMLFSINSGSSLVSFSSKISISCSSSFSLDLGASSLSFLSELAYSNFSDFLSPLIYDPPAA